MQVILKIDDSELKSYSSSIKKGAISKAAVRTLNRQVRSSRKDIRKRVSKMAGVPAMRIQQVMRLSYASRGKYTAGITIRDKWIKLSYFKYRVLKKGVRAKVWGRHQFYPGTFKAVMPSGHIGIFKPWGRTLGPRERWMRTPTGRI